MNDEGAAKMFCSTSFSMDTVRTLNDFSKIF